MSLRLEAVEGLEEEGPEVEELQEAAREARERGRPLDDVVAAAPPLDNRTLVGRRLFCYPWERSEQAGL